MKRAVVVMALFCMMPTPLFAKKLNMEELKDKIQISQDINFFNPQGEIVGKIGPDYIFEGDVKESFQVLFLDFLRLRAVQVDYINRVQGFIDLIKNNEQVQKDINSFMKGQAVPQEKK